MTESRDLLVAQPPQAFDLSTTAGVMWLSSALLLPAAGWGVYLYGVRAALVLFVAISAALVSEILAASLMGRRTLDDGSAFLCGLMLGMTMPPSVPLALPAIAAAFAILVVKWSFGGLGTNWMNPALAGRAFVFFSWRDEMTRWVAPVTLSLPDSLTSATPLGIAADAGGGAASPMQALRAAGYPVTALDASVTEWLNTRLLGTLGVDLPSGYVDLFVGYESGAIGEASALLLLAASVLLFARRIITWQIPLSFFASFAVLTGVFGGIPFGSGLFAGDVLFAVGSGGFALALFFFATDPVTSPATPRGMIIYGSAIGVLAFLIRTFGAFPEASGLAILLANIFVPSIDRLTQPRRFGLQRPRQGAVAP